MFDLFSRDIEAILTDFGISSEPSRFTELQRYHYEEENPQSREVRLIEKVQLANGSSVVIRCKNEEDVSLELIEEQSRFAALLRENGIPCPMQYTADGAFAKWYRINGYDVIVTVEEFVDGELQCVTAEAAEKTGRLLARSHNISEAYDFHVNNAVLFDPFTDNDLYKYEEFRSVGFGLPKDSMDLFHKITERYDAYMRMLSPLREEPRYAVQGDISNCNLYRLQDGSIGMFDFNRCGDNSLYCDAVMQAIFEARLMDYPKNCSEQYGQEILVAFLTGYQAERPFSDLQKKLFPYLYAVVDAFWASDIVWGEDSLLKEYDRKNADGVHKWLEEIWNRLVTLPCLFQSPDRDERESNP